MKRWLINSIVSGIEPSNLLQVAHDFKQPRSDMTPTGSTLLYAACRLQNPSIDLVRRILFEKMKILNDSKLSIKVITGEPRSVISMYSIIPNGSANGSYPQHAAVQAIKQILNGISPHPPRTIISIDGTDKNRILNIFTILQMLKSYDKELAEHIRLGKQVITPDEFKEDTHTPLMSKTNHFGLTAYEEYANSFDGKPSIKDILAHMPQQEGHLVHPFNTEDFDKVLDPTDPVSVAAGSAGDASALPPGWEEFTSADGRIYYGNKELDTTQWVRPVISSEAPSPVSVAAGSAGAAPPSYEKVMGNLEKYRLYDPITGRQYYIDPVTGDHVWV